MQVNRSQKILIHTRHRELLLQRDLSNLYPSSRASFAKRSLYSAPVIASFFCEAISPFRTRHREPLLRRDLSDQHPSSRASFATRSLFSSFVHQPVHVLTARLLHHFAISTLTHHLRQYGKVIRNDGGIVTAMFFCLTISLICSRHREPLLRSDLSEPYPSSRTSFATRSVQNKRSHSYK